MTFSVTGNDFSNQFWLGCRKAAFFLYQDNQTAYEKACNRKPADTSRISFRVFCKLMPKSNDKEKQNRQQPQIVLTVPIQQLGTPDSLENNDQD
jgi:hypothetical protein